MQSTGALISGLMEARGLSREDLQRKMKVSRATVYHWLSGRCFPGRRLERKLAKILGTTVGALHDESAA